MKTILTPVLVFLMSLSLFAQKKVIKIDLKSSIYTFSTVIEKGEYEIQLENYDDNKRYEISIEREYHTYESLSLPEKKDDKEEQQSLQTSTKTIDTIDLKHNQDLTIKVVVLGKKENDGSFQKEKEYKYTYQTRRKGSWQSTFGFNFIRLSNTDTYFSKTQDDNYVVTKGTNQNQYDFHPSIMFTWLQNNGKEVSFGVSGGLGFDLEKSVSVFLGGAVSYNQNITLTIGMAFHNQKRLNSQYKEGDTLAESLDFDQLHKDYMRLNPFISISFRLDKSPF